MGFSQASRAGTHGPLLVLASGVSVQFGQAFGKHLFAAAGPVGVVVFRLGFAALLLLAWGRPGIPRDRRSRWLVLAFGTAIAGNNIVYPAMVFLPLGVATTLQLLGPLVVALAASRRAVDLLWAMVAALGVLLFVYPDLGTARLAWQGVGLALLSGVSMGLYVLFSQRVSAHGEVMGSLALAVSWAALLTMPFGVADTGTALLHPLTMLAGLGVAVLSVILPYWLVLRAQRWVPAYVVGVVLSLEPAVAALAGAMVLGEELTVAQLLAIGCVTVASIGAVGSRRRHAARTAQENPRLSATTEARRARCS